MIAGDDNCDEDTHGDQFEWLTPKEIKAAGERSKEQATIPAYENAYGRSEDWVFEACEATYKMNHS